MNIQACNPYSPVMTPYGGSPFMGGASSLMMMMQSLLMMMQQIIAMQSGQNPMGCGCNPNFGSGMGMPDFGGMGMPGFPGGMGMPGAGGFPGFGNFSGGSCAPGGSYGGDSYVPGGSGPSGPVGNLGSGQGSDAVRWALGQEGVSESNNPGRVRQYSRGAWQPWCADFVSSAYENSPGGSPFGHISSVSGILDWGRRNNKFFDAGTAASNPSMLRPGDIAVWKSGGKSHVGLVTGVNSDGTFSTVEGNSGDAVRRRNHSFGAGLTGFVRPRG